MNPPFTTLFPVIFMLGVWQAHAQPLPPEGNAWLAQRTIQVGEMIEPTDVAIGHVNTLPFGALTAAQNPSGMDARHRILNGYPVLARDVEPHVLVRANMPVQVIWQSGAIRMVLEARALEQGAAGDFIRVLNTASSRTLQGTVLPDGRVQVGN